MIEDMDEAVRKLVKEGSARDMGHLLLCMIDRMQGVSTNCANENDQYLAELGMSLATWKRGV
jgi:hypothetical protein